ncbi:type I toxin-antitoxin system Fst family toxin [Levilactobacillus lanxiensis]|uniref:Type I toxin-antitoxin system Fst family toxin n=1 Tax=Levilactobacillus lanxiensis TaxID=2799568 RepID=A0ABW4D693_9LACO
MNVLLQVFFAPLVVGLLVALFTDWLDRRRHR